MQSPIHSSGSPDLFPNHLHSPHRPDSFGLHSPQNTNHQSLYSTIHHLASDFTPTPSDHDDQRQQGKLNGIPPGPYSTSTAFNAFGNANARNPAAAANTAPYRDPTVPQPYPTSVDMYAASRQPVSQNLSPPQSSLTSPTHVYESLPGQGRAAFDFRGAPFPGHNKPPYNNMDSFNPAMLQAQRQHSNYHAGPQGAYANGIHMQSSTPFGPHLPTNPGGGPGPTGPGMSHPNTAAPASSQEEISTIFVVGFPDDMSEREFQNMFTFSQGFEAATLKIPNKDNSSYGSGNSASRGGAPYQNAYAGPNDPYNLVTVNQGGVLVDGGRDGTTASWPTSIPDDGHYVPNPPTQPPRKQIIGFAKFRTRQEALEARDVLQGRRVDIEKGAILKAEMAKKNLHTKRGVGPLGVPLSTVVANNGGGIIPPEALAGLAAGLNVSGGAHHSAGSEALSARERELGALGAMGFGGLRRDSRVGAVGDEHDRRRDGEVGLRNAMGLSVMTTRGPRERAEEEERDRRRAENLRSSNVTAFDAFHSHPNLSKDGMNGLPLHSQSSMPNLSAQEGYGAGGSGPWGGAFSRPSLNVSALPQRPSSDTHNSPPTSDPSSYPLSGPNSASSCLSDNGRSNTLPGSAPFSPPSATQALPLQTSLPARPRPLSPTEPQAVFPTSSASSVSGSQGSGEGDLSGSMAALALRTTHGSTSPQLPSPASGASSGTRGNPSDQNPPINTLYVGNLPNSPMPPGYSSNYLEERLRELFKKQPGFCKLCYRQKSNGPMCFVEFKDVQAATKALNDLYGETLDGFIKGGGIRLSYSKNPLGVRTPTSGQSSAGQQSFSSMATLETYLPQQPVPVSPTFLDMELTRSLRGDNSGMTSPVGSYHYASPPRFFSPPISPPFDQPSSSFSRASSQGFGLPPVSTTFSPFGMSPSPRPNQELPAPETSEHSTPALPSTSNTIEPAPSS